MLIPTFIRLKIISASIAAIVVAIINIVITDLFVGVFISDTLSTQTFRTQ